MSQSSESLRSQIISVLADSEFHSGQKLAERFSISRTAVANHISALIELGVEIYSVKGKGYRISEPLDLLSKDKMMVFAPDIASIPLDVLSVVDSTNTVLRQQLDSIAHGQTVIAEAQTAGRGRRGRTWVSPFAASLYLSMCWRFQGGYQQIGGLSLFVGYCLIEALSKHGVDGLGLKWPNDIYHHGRKLGGILVEVEGQIGSEVTCIIGVGININLPDSVKGIDQPFSDLSEYAIDRNHLCSSIVAKLHQALPEFEQFGIERIVEQWNQLDVFAGKPVTIIGTNQNHQGISLGINAQGALQLDTDNGIVVIHGGEVSLRAAS